MTSSEHGDGKSADAVLRGEQLLESWPLAEPNPAFFDANHDAIMARIGLLKPGVRSSDDALLEAPLPQVSGEPSALLTPAVSTDAPRAKSRENGESLRELAERALGAAPDGSAEGRTELGTENGTERTSAVHRAFGGHLRGFDLRDEDDFPERGNVVPLHADLGHPAAPTAAASVAPIGTTSPRTTKERWPMAVTALSAAAGFLLWWSLERANHSPMVAAPSTALELGAAPGSGDQDIAGGAGDVRAVAAPAAGKEPASETRERAPGSETATAERPGEKGRGMAAGVELAKAPAELGGPATAGAPSVEIVPEEVVLEEEEEAPAKTNERGESLIPDDPRLRPAAEQTPVVQQPAVGAVQGAFGQVLPGARACVVGQAAPSRATVTFGSDGTVRSVVVEGPAKGTPADACIQHALGRARLAPFAKPSFSATTTVRP